MNILIVYAHPNPKSFCRAIVDALEKVSVSKGHQVHVRDLYALDFNPILSGQDIVGIKSGNVPKDIAVEQNEIHWSHLIIFVHPIWWTSMPAILKGYFDRVFSNGFAFGMKDGKMRGFLADKKVILFNTLGNSKASTEESGMLRSLTQTISEGVLAFASMQVLGQYYFFSVPSVSPDERQAMLNQAEEIVKKL